MVLLPFSSFIMKLEENILLYYHRHPSMYKFQELMNKLNKRDTFRFMIFIKIVMKDYDAAM